jgi:hypothetical protein
MIERIGKILVYTILVFSIFLAVLGVAVFANVIDWYPSAGPPKVEGIHDENIKEITQRQEDMARLRARWKNANNTLLALEFKRDSDRQWYKEQVDMLRTGKDAKGQKVNDPVKKLDYEADGRLKLDGVQLPALGPNADARLKDQESLDAVLKKLNEDIKKEIAAINDLVKLQKEYSLQLLGEPGKRKGLLALLEQSLKDKQNALKELEAARQEAINGRVAVQVLLARKKQLQARVKELKDFAAAAVREKPNPN